MAVRILTFEKWREASGAFGTDAMVYPSYEQYLSQFRGECHACGKERVLNQYGACSSCERDARYETHSSVCYCDAWETCDAR